MDDRLRELDSDLGGSGSAGRLLTISAVDDLVAILLGLALAVVLLDLSVALNRHHGRLDLGLLLQRDVRRRGEGREVVNEILLFVLVN